VPLSEVAGALERIVKHANDVLYAEAEGLPRHLRMGATLSLLLVMGDQAVVADVGDSRVYRVRKGEATLLVRDDTLAQEVAEESELDLDPEHAQASQFSHVLTQALGIDSEVKVELRTVGVEAGDRFLLCTDGLSEPLGAEAEATVGARIQGELASRPAALLEAAAEAGSEDNRTAVVVEVAAAGPAS
jgi:protein phosphatase